MSDQPKPINDDSVTIRCDDHKVLLSGAALLYQKNGKIAFEFSDTQNGPFIFELQFVDETKEMDKYSVTYDDKNSTNRHVIFICVGYDNPDGAGLLEPVKVLERDGKSVYFRFIAFSMKQIPYIVYTFYIDE